MLRIRAISLATVQFICSFELEPQLFVEIPLLGTMGGLTSSKPKFPFCVLVCFFSFLRPLFFGAFQTFLGNSQRTCFMKLLKMFCYLSILFEYLSTTALVVVSCTKYDPRKSADRDCSIVSECYKDWYVSDYLQCKAISALQHAPAC